MLKKKRDYFIWGLDHSNGYFLALDYETNSSYLLKKGELVRYSFKSSQLRPSSLDEQWVPVSKTEFIKCIAGGLPYMKDKYEHSFKSYSLSGVS